MEKLFKILLILVFLALLGFVLHALCVKKGYCHESYVKAAMECLAHPMKQSYSEWAFVNLNKYVTGGFIGQNGRGICGWHLVDADEYTLKGYFRYTTWEELKKKWKGKPKPKGFDEFFKLYPKEFFYREEK